MMQRNTMGAKTTTQPSKPVQSAKKPSRISPKESKPLAKEEIPPFINPNDRAELERNLKSNLKSMEVEASFGTFKTNERTGNTFFEPGVSVSQFNTLLGHLSSLFQHGIWSSSFPIPELTVTLEEADNRKDGPRVKKITDAFGNVTWMEKQRHTKETIDNETWGYRISKSTEKINTEGPKDFVANFWRRKERRTFLVVSDTSDLYGVQFDLTIVKETAERFDHKTKTMRMQTSLKYEVEIERKSIISIAVMEKAIGLVINVIQHASDPSQLLTMPQREMVINNHNRLFQSSSGGEGGRQQPPVESDSYNLHSNYWNKPENIKIDDMLNPENKFAVTVKIDGVRRFLLITRNSIFSCLPPRDIWKIGGGNTELDGTLLDTEAYRDDNGQVTYYVFDVLFYKNKDVRNDYFLGGGGRTGRLDMLNEVSTKLKFFKGEIAQAKTFYFGPDFYENVKNAFEHAAELESQEVRLDGLVCQSHVWYKNFFTRKWKPSNMLTIDFKFHAGSKKDEFTILVKTPSGYAPFAGSRRNPFPHSPTIELSGGILKGIENSGGLILNPPGDGLIVECIWSAEDEKFVPVRYRDDKEEPNFIKVAEDVWDDIVKPVSKDDIMGNSLIVMRRFHNLAKKHFLEQEFKRGDTIMDWGSGRGGDIGKWMRLGLKRVFVVEPNKENFAEFERRRISMEKEWLAERKRGPDIIPIKEKGRHLVGAERTDVIFDDVRDVPVLSGIVSFFSLTFFGKDKGMFDQMIETIDKTLSVGGKFVGIVMDGTRVQKLLEQDKEAKAGESLMYECPAFSITQTTDFDPDKVKKGANEIEIKIREESSMVDQTEWLFYFSVLKKSLEKIGFVLKYDGFLDEKESPLLALPQGKKEKRPVQLFNVLNTDGKTFSSLNRYFMFERVSKKGISTSPPTKASPKILPEIKDEIDEIREFPFNFLETYWAGEIPKNEDRDFYLIRPVPPGPKWGVIHAILYAIDSKYRELNSRKERVDRVYSVLRMISSKMDFDLFCQAMRGPVYDKSGKLLKKKQDFDKLELECAEFRLNLEGADEIFTGILSHLLQINIMTIEVSSKEIILDSERHIFGCFENTIVILKTPSKKSYDVIAYTKDDKTFMAYATKSPFIRHMIKSIAESKKFRGARMTIAE